MRSNPLTAEQIEQAKHLRKTLPRGQTSWRNIAGVIGVAERQLLLYFNPDFRAYVEARKDLIRSKAHYGEKGNQLTIPDEVLADRERRQLLPQSIFGDPLPGYSALDKKLNAQTPA